MLIFFSLYWSVGMSLISEESNHHKVSRDLVHIKLNVMLFF